MMFTAIRIGATVVTLALGLSVTTKVAPRAAPKKLLFLTHSGFYKHTSLAPAERAVAALGKQGGFEVTALEGYKQDGDKLDLLFVSAEYLAQFDGLMMMTNGELPLTDSQKRAMIDFVRGGKGFVAVHNTPVTLYTYPPFGEMLGGYFLRTFDAMNRLKRMTVLRVEDRKHPATSVLGESWSLHDEFYQFGSAAWDPGKPEENVAQVGQKIPVGLSRDRVHVLLSIDTERTDLTGLGAGWKRGGDYPQAWYQHFGKGRSFYTSLGHRDDLWSSDPLFRAHILGAIRWSLGLEN